MHIRYFALKPLKVGQGWRQPGEEVPEAASWGNVTPYITTGYLSAVVMPEGEPGSGDSIEIRTEGGRRREGGVAPRVPLRAARWAHKDYADTGPEQGPLAERLDPAAEEEADEEVSEVEEPEEEEEEVNYYDLSVEEVEREIRAGNLDPDDVDAWEDERPKGRRKGIDRLLEQLADEEEDDEE